MPRKPKRDFVDQKGLKDADVTALQQFSPPHEMPFNITKLGHVVLMVKDVQRATDFYTKVLGFRISDVYPESMMPGKMVFLRFNHDHHGVALVGGSTREVDNCELHHMAFQVETLDEVFHARGHLKNTMSLSNLPVDGARGARSQWNFVILTAMFSKYTGILIRLAQKKTLAQQASGGRLFLWKMPSTMHRLGRMSPWRIHRSGVNGSTIN